MQASLIKEAVEIKDQLVDWRRDFHRHPELGLQLNRTAGVVASELKHLGLIVRTRVAETGVVGLLKGGQPGPVIMLRFDMDALPIMEDTGASYASVNPGVMHACGHDGHTAIGLGVARLLCRHQKELPGVIKFIFQPGEEGFAGAQRMIEEGVLENPAPIRSLAMHLWNTHPVGWIGLTPGPAMAGAEKIEIVIQGKGGHAAAPDLAVDPVVAAAQVIAALQTVVSRNVDPIEAAVVSISEVKAGDVFNVIPPNARLKGTIRTFKPKVRELVIRRVEEIASNVARAMGCKADVECLQISLPLVNDIAVTKRLHHLVLENLPELTIDDSCRVMGSEDMADFMHKVPGCYIFVGSNNPTRGLDSPHHSPKFDFDENALPLGAGLMAAAAWEELEAG